MNKRFADVYKSVLKKTGRRRKSAVYRSLKDGDLANPIQLDEFLDGVGEIMRLAPKTVEPQPKESIARVAGRNWIRLLLPLATIVLVAFAIQSAPGEEPSVPLPSSVLGIWSTADPRYANRRFELTRESIAFKHGDRPDDQSVHQISAVRAKQMGDSTLIRVTYLEAGGSYELSFKYSMVPEPGIRFSHQEELAWRRAMK